MYIRISEKEIGDSFDLAFWLIGRHQTGTALANVWWV